MSTSSRPMRVCILGSTGSIGTSTLDVLSRHPDRFEVFALTAHHRVDELLAQCLASHTRLLASSFRKTQRDRSTCSTVAVF